MIIAVICSAISKLQVAVYYSNLPYFLSVSLLYLSQAIKRTIDRKTVDVYALLSAGLNDVTLVIWASSLTPAHMPQHAGQVHMTRALRSRIERPIEVRFCVCVS